MNDRTFWIIQRHTSGMELLVTVAKYLLENQGQVIDNIKINSILTKLEKEKLYKSRKETYSNTTLQAKINQLCYYMIGYKDNLGKNFIFSPLGKVYWESFSNDTYRNYTFLSLLFAMQYPHPHSRSLEEFNLFPFRLIFKLFLDKRIDNLLYGYEIFMFIMAEKNVTKDSYEKLIKKIITYRNKDNNYIDSLIKENQYTYVNPLYEWDYYTKKILEFHSLIEVKKIGNSSVELFHKTNNPITKPTKRLYIKTQYSINPEYKEFATNLLEEWRYDEIPIKLNSPDSLKIENVRLIYSKFPNTLFNILKNENQKLKNDFSELLTIPKLINDYSINLNNNKYNEFEKIIEKALNLFNDVNASRISGPGNTDIECLYIDLLDLKHKFNVEAKSTSKKLIQINSGRLKQHIQKTSAEYCIVVTPKYLPAAVKDIKNEKIVIITSSSLSEFIYQGIISNSRLLSFEKVYEIIINNYGTDISEKIYNLSFKIYGNQLNL